jgi:hypothetical protein
MEDLVGADKALWLRIVGGPRCCIRRGRLLGPRKKIVMVDDATMVALWKRLLTDPRVSDTEVRRLCLMALLGNEDFRLRVLEWFLRDASGRVDLPSLCH